MDAICQPDCVQSIWHSQLSFNEANMHLDQSQDLDLGTWTWTWTWTNQSPSTWLMLSNMMINMVSTISYNSKSKQALSSVKLRIDNDVNASAKKVGIWDMDCNPLKINQPEVTYLTPLTSSVWLKRQDITGQSRKFCQNWHHIPCGQQCLEVHSMRKVADHKDMVKFAYEPSGPSGWSLCRFL